MLLLLAVGVSVTALRLRSASLQFDGELYALSAPVSPNQPAEFFVNLHGLLRPPLRRLVAGQPWISLELIARDGKIGMQIWIPRGEKPFVESLLRSAYPGLVLSPSADAAADRRPAAAATVRLSRNSDLPIRTTFDGDPLSSLLWTLARVPAVSGIWLQLLVRPKRDGWQRAARGRAQALRDRRRVQTSLFTPTRVLGPTRSDRDQAKAIETKLAGLGFDCVLRVAASAGQGSEAREYVRSVGAGLRSFAGDNSFALRSVFCTGRVVERLRRRHFPLFGRFVLTPAELAGLWPLPGEAPPQLQIARAMQLAPPLGATDGERLVGVSTWANEERPVRLSLSDSRSHMHLLGSTGTGKTTAMLNLAVQDVQAGRGVAVLDPKGDLVRGLLERIPRERIADVVLLSPEAADRSVGINPLELWPGDDRDLVAENTLTIFKRIYERYWGPRTDDILKSALLTLLRLPGSTLAHVPLLLTDAEFRRRALADLDDPLGLDGFWRWFEGLSETQRSESIGPVLNKLRDFLLRPRLRRLLCQPRSTVDLRSIVDSGQILLADLSVGRWGDTTSALIGSFLVARIWQAALARSVLREDERRDFFLFVDEFQHFLGIAGPFADVLAEARSLRLSLCIANQHLGQLTRDLREAVASNARSRLVFQCGQDDAAYLAREFAPLDATALMSLGRFETAARLSVDGRSSQPFTLRTLPLPPAADPAVAGYVRAASAARFARPAELIDRELRAALEVDVAASAAKARRRRSG